jgi:hypothetical protein
LGRVEGRDEEEEEEDDDDDEDCVLVMPDCVSAFLLAVCARLPAIAGGRAGRLTL